MQFTPQQLAGAGRFNPRTRIGNWNEDLVLEECRMKDYRLRKEKGMLTTNSQQQKFAICNQKVPHSYSSDGIIRYDDYVLIAHEQTGGTLATDIWEETTPGSSEYNVTISRQIYPTARNVLKIVKAKESNNSSDELKYGEVFRLECNESLRADSKTNTLKPSLYLKSSLKTSRDSSPITSNQLVSMSCELNANTLWYAVSGDTNGPAQVLKNGTPIQTGDRVALVHKMTNQALFADSKNEVLNDFQKEYEVCCLSTRKPGKCHNLVGEFKGSVMSESSGMQVNPQNTWSILLGNTPDAAVDNRRLPAPATPAVLLDRVRDIIRQRGGHGYHSIKRAFSRMDDNGNGQLDREDFKWGLRDYGIDLRDDQYDTLLDLFDRDSNGMISLKEFVSVLRGEMNDRRVNLVELAYDKLDRTGDGKVTLQDLIDVYDTSCDERVTGGLITHEQAIEEFMSVWDTHEKDGVITPSEFKDYYADVSAAIESDDYFELMIRNAWHLSGGMGK